MVFDRTLSMDLKKKKKITPCHCTNIGMLLSNGFYGLTFHAIILVNFVCTTIQGEIIFFTNHKNKILLGKHVFT